MTHDALPLSLCAQHDLVGHLRPVVASRFSPSVFKSGDGGRPYCVLALGDDSGNVVTIWASFKDRPVCAIRDLFQGPITDLTWSHDDILMACSQVGPTMRLM